MDKVAIIGAGLIGRSFAVTFARGGFEVALWDPANGVADAAWGWCSTALADLAAHGLVDSADAARARILVASTLPEALEGARHVQECGPEVRNLKAALFAELDSHAAPDAILASSTSAILPSLFTEDLPGRGRMLVAHPVNPPHLVPIIELCGAPWTEAGALQTAHETFEAIGQVPILVRHEVDGFVLNRLQAALLTEAFRLVRDGAVSPHDLDKVVSEGLGLRWSFMGPFQTIALNAPGGIPDYCARYTPFFRRLQSDPPDDAVWSEDATEKVAAAWGTAPEAEAQRVASGWRDRRLAALAAHKAAQDALPK